ncbi:MAG: Zn-dependent hydrolase [Synergistaceae bacterium]|jgi:allantoate deiminase/N-carbamoyl-L-amino-acid hydrolase|nr:Zn-dependent hydrolase [Synergistaceae bacterium]
MLKTNGARVVDRLEKIYSCGERADGAHSRLAFSPEDIKARELFMGYFRELGIEPRVDAAGNIIARLRGDDDSLPAIMTGSHLDTVPDGGKYDGALGCIAGLEIVETLVCSGVRTRHPIEVIVFTDEEGARFGSGMIGSSAFCAAPLDGFKPTDTDMDGISRKEALSAFGMNLNKIGGAARAEGTVRCFLELHVEQGGFLFRKGIPIGIVTAIAGVKRSEVVIRGVKNHAGSTMMSDRRDALVAASRFISSVPEITVAHGGAYSVATVGYIAVQPNSVNVIPGVCTFSLEIRDQDMEVIERIEKNLESALEEIAGTSGVSHDIRPISSNNPALMNASIGDAIAKAAEEAELGYVFMPSGAFHDSLMLSRSFPTGMIFIPSVNGISHSSEEFSTPEDIQKGCDVLLETAMILDRT